MTYDYDVVIVGAGAAGVGLAHVLKSLEIERFVVLERHEVGASFRRWPSEMRFITPSFTSNAFGLVDLNAITFGTSPAFTLDTEHPSGRQYAQYLAAIVDEYELPVNSGVDVLSITPVRHSEATDECGFVIRTATGQITARFVVWAAGEFQYPRRTSFPGADLCRLITTIPSWRIAVREATEAADLVPVAKPASLLMNMLRTRSADSVSVDPEPWVVIGGYESGIDAAVNLVRFGQRAVVVDPAKPWETTGSDPSRTLSPYTLGRLNRALGTERLELVGATAVIGVAHEHGRYVVTSTEETWRTPHPPILATGFTGSLRLIEPLFEWSDEGHVVLNEQDESTLTPGLFVTGPQVRHENVIFCFVYKFRQRFAVIAHSLAERLGVDPTPLDEYRSHGMFLDDLSCCEDECTC